MISQYTFKEIPDEVKIQLLVQMEDPEFQNTCSLPGWKDLCYYSDLTERIYEERSRLRIPESFIKLREEVNAGLSKINKISWKKFYESMRNFVVALKLMRANRWVVRDYIKRYASNDDILELMTLWAIPEYREFFGPDALSTAILRESTKVLKFLLEQGLRPDMRTMSSKTIATLKPKIREILESYQLI